MSYNSFPTLPSGAKLDSKKFGIEHIDNTVRKEIEGGYTATRPRTTRKNRLSFKCGYTYIDNADKAAVAAFWQLVHGGSRIFTWTSPQDGVAYSVRFKGNLAWKYVGHGSEQRWDCDFELEQA
jgi:hypothetical protein